MAHRLQFLLAIFLVLGCAAAFSSDDSSLTDDRDEIVPESSSIAEAPSTELTESKEDAGFVFTAHHAIASAKLAKLGHLHYKAYKIAKRAHEDAKRAKRAQRALSRGRRVVNAVARRRRRGA